jgi:hypothetical protein
VALQVSWYSTPTTYETYGRPDVTTSTPTSPRRGFVVRMSGAAAGGTTTAFAHPGVLLGTAQLDYVKARLTAGAEPWTAEYAKMLASRCTLTGSANNGRLYSDLSWVPTPYAVVARGSGGSNASGDQDQQADAIAAYCHSLIWYYTGARASAVKATQILNAWGTTLTTMRFDTTTYADGLLQSAWVGSMFPRSAEIVRYTFTPTGSETVLNVAAVQGMFNILIAMVKDGWTGGGANWLATMADALMQMAVFNEDRPMFDLACTNWRSWTRSQMYMTGDANRWAQLAGSPISPRLQIPNRWGNVSTVYDRATTTATQVNNYWYSPTSYIDGLQGEMGRDPWHMAMGYSSIGYAAETARLQGVDLYGEEMPRIIAATERACRYIYDVYVEGVNPPPDFPFGANGNWGTRPTDMQRMTWSAIRNHYVMRLGLSMPETTAVLTDYVAATGYRAALHQAFERLTHTGTP